MSLANDQYSIARRKLARHIARAALPERFEINGKSGLLLEQLGIVKSSKLNSDESILNLLADGGSVLDAKVPLGPLLVFKESAPNERQYAGLMEFVTSSSLQIRKAALKRLKHHCAAGVILPRTHSVLKQTEASILNSDSHHWQLAAIKLLDAISNDFLYTLSGLNQCVFLRYEAGAKKYLRELFRMDIISIDNFPVKYANLPLALGEISLSFKKIRRNSEISTVELCRNYFSEFGHLPLCKRYSLGGLLGSRIRIDNRSRVWHDLWDWADESDSILAQYHVSKVFLDRPEWVDEAQVRRLWNAIFPIINFGATDESSVHWSLFNSLTRIFYSRVECTAPMLRSDVCASVALRAAYLVHPIILPLCGGMTNWLSGFIEGELEVSGFIAQFKEPTGDVSPVAYNIKRVKSIWSMAITSSFPDDLRQLNVDGLSASERDLLQGALVSNLVSSCPPATESPIYAIDTSGARSVFIWANQANTDSELKNSLLQFAGSRRYLDDVENLTKAVSSLTTRTAVDQYFVLSVVRSMIETRKSSRERILDLLSQESIYKVLFSGLSEEALEVFCNVMVSLQSELNQRFRYHIPEWFAVECEKARTATVRDILFSYTINSALNANSNYAIRRLMMGAFRSQLADSAARIRENFENVMTSAPGWLEGRFRMGIASLHCF